MSAASLYLKARAPLLGFLASVAVLCVCLQAEDRIENEEMLAEALGQASGGAVESFVWGKSGGPLSDYLFGRPLLYSAKAEVSAAGAGGDVFSLRIRLSPEGRVLGFGTPTNLTETQSAHEHGLTGAGGFAMFATTPEIGPRSLTLVSFSPSSVQKQPLLDRIQVALRNYFATGLFAGLAMSDVILQEGKAEAWTAELRGDSLSLSSRSGRTEEKVTHYFHDRALQLAPALEKAGLTLNPRVTTAVPWLHFFADTGRRLVGPGAVAWLEGRTFSLKDGIHRVASRASFTERPEAQRPSLEPARKQPEVRSESAWPPPDLKNAGLKEEDGIWRPLSFKPQNPGAAHDVSPSAAPYFYRTVLHVDEERPYAELHLVVMDMRRLSLGIGAGYEDPHPDTGPPGSGHIPTDPGVAERVVATFNGGFKATHGRYGMKAEGRMLVAPVTGAASVVIDEAGRVGFGTWTTQMNQSDYVALRQNLDPLVEEGKPNPTGRKVWGEHLYGAGVAVERTALCLHESGNLIYAWTTEATGETLASGLSKAGCSYAIHLDMNPGHCAFLLNEVESVEPLAARGRPLDPRMNVNPTRYVRWSPKDFFYVLRAGDVPSSEHVTFQVSEGESPTPQSIPGLFTGQKTIAQIPVTVDRVNAGRLSYSLGIGSGEGGAAGTASDEAEKKMRPLIAWGMGHATRGSRPGLSIGTRPIVPLKRNYASLILEGGQLSLRPPDEPQVEEPGRDVVQLPVLARDTKLVPEAQELGGRRQRAALCMDGEGNLLVARMEHDTPAPLARLLVDMGCDLVVELDRGSHPPALVERSGTQSPPGANYEQTLLYGSDSPMTPRTFLTKVAPAP